MSRIVLIDDDHGPMDLYVKALRMSGFEVQHLDTVAAALNHVRDADRAADFYIIDVVMPPGDSLTLEESSYGLTSGIVIYKRLREKFPDVPVIILTNISTPGILEALPVDDRNAAREAKIELLPSDLVRKVKEHLGA